jgi:outer membrane protein OmpA-like peptidoglycan-associated protein
MKIRVTSFWLLIMSSPALLGACTTPAAGPNAGASSAAGPVAGASAPGGTVPLASKPTVGKELAAVADNKVQITFPEGSATLTASANQQLDLAARLFRDANPVVMFAAGYTDRSGEEFSNLLLSARRAQAVKQGLAARGIPPDRLLIQAFGESELANTADPLAAENRRAVITWRLL